MVLLLVSICTLSIIFSEVLFIVCQETHFFRIPKDCCIESKSPDDNLFKYLAHIYADNHPEMHRGDACPPEIFPNGVTNGAYW